MKKLLLPLLCLTCVLASADVTMEQKIEAATTNGSILVRLKGDLERIDLPGSQVGEVSIILDLKEGQTTTLIHGQKVFTVESIEATKKKSEDRLKEAKIDFSKDVAPKASGQKEKVDKWDTEIFEGVVAGNKVRYWVAKDVPDYKAINDQLGKFIAAIPSGAFDPAKHDLGGLIVKSETLMEKGKTTMTVVDVQEKELPADLFKVPPDYKPFAGAAPENAASPDKTPGK